MHEIFRRRILISCTFESAIAVGCWIAVTCYLLWFLLPASAYSHDWEFPYKLEEMGFFGFAKDFYLFENGRLPVHLISAFLGDDYAIWRILQSLLLASFPIFILREVRQRQAVGFAEACVLLVWVGLILNFEPIYHVIGFAWVTGAANYVWPILGSLYLYFAHQSISANSSVTSVLSCGLLALLVGFSFEISAAIGVSLVLASCFQQVCFKKNSSWKIWLPLGCLLVGFALLTLAPGNSVRVDRAQYIATEQILFNLPHVIFEWFHGDTYFRLHVLLACMSPLAVLTQAIDKNEHRLSWRFSLVMAALLALCFFNLGELSAPSGFSVVLLCNFITLVCALILLFVHRRPALAIFFIISVCAQCMLLIVPAIGPRTFLPILLLLAASVMTLSYDIFTKVKHLRYATAMSGAVSLVFFSVSASNANDIRAGFRSNFHGQQENLARIKVWKLQDPAPQVLVLKRLPAPRYHWEMPYQNSYFLKYYLANHHVSEEAIVVWEGPKTDRRQRRFIEEVVKMNSGPHLSWKPTLDFTLPTGASSSCHIRSDGQFIVFSSMNWKCINQVPFNIEVGASQGKPTSSYNGVLANDRYMPVVQNWHGPRRTNYIYTIDEDPNNPSYQHVNVTWGNRVGSVR